MNSLNKIVAIFIFATSCFSCVEDKLYDATIGQKSNVIQLHLPQAADIALQSEGTRSTASNAELMIHRGVVLIFNNDKFASHSNIVKENVANNGKKNVTITIKNSSFIPATSKLVFVFNHDETNAPADFNGITTDNISSYFPMSTDFLAAIQKNDPVKGIPMFSSDFAGTLNGTIRTVYRSLAKLQVEIAAGIKVDKIHNFGHENITFKVKNAATDGIIGFNHVDSLSYNNQISVANNPTTEKSLFDFKTNLLNETNPDNYTNALFLYEFPHKDKIISATGETVKPIDAVKFNSDRITLILKHTDEVADHGERFYRIDIVGKNATTLKKSYLDIKRNHHYKVKITAVNSRGYITEEEAYIHPSSNIEYEIFDDGGNVTTSNGQYAISMDDILNYDTIRIYSHYDVRLDIDNICYILPEEMGGLEQNTEITNEVYFTPGEKIGEGDLQLVVERNPFQTDPKLTNQRKDIKMVAKGKQGRWEFGLHIKFGNLELGRKKITIIKVPTMLDAHPGQVRIQGTKINTDSWQTEFEDFGSRYDAETDETVIYAGDNVTPIGYIHLDGSSSDGESAKGDAQPVFEDKLHVGYYDNVDKTNNDSVIGSTKIILAQHAPFYIGRFGNKSTDGGLHLYNQVVMEKIEEMPGEEDGKHGQGPFQMKWADVPAEFYSPDLIATWIGENDWSKTAIYINLTDGLAITKYIMKNYMESNSAMPYAIKLCYLRNDTNGNGTVDSDEKINWYLPALNQLLGTWINFNVFTGDDHKPDNSFLPNYWTASEVANGGTSFNAVNTVSFLTGGTEFPEKSTWSNAKIRCVRDI